MDAGWCSRCISRLSREDVELEKRLFTCATLWLAQPPTQCVPETRWGHVADPCPASITEVHIYLLVGLN